MNEMAQKIFGNLGNPFSANMDEMEFGEKDFSEENESQGKDSDRAHR